MNTVVSVLEIQQETLQNMSDTMNTVVSLLEIQQQTLQNMSDTMNTVVSVLETQQETLQNMSDTTVFIVSDMFCRVSCWVSSTDTTVFIVTVISGVADFEPVKGLLLGQKHLPSEFESQSSQPVFVADSVKGSQFHRGFPGGFGAK